MLGCNNTPLFFYLEISNSNDRHPHDGCGPSTSIRARATDTMATGVVLEHEADTLR